MIKKLKYDEVDWEKYQKCLENSEQYHFFAEKNYLDILLNKNWNVIVYGDYQAVMPIPLVVKMRLIFVLMPLQTQQLGVFSEKDNVELNQIFYNFFCKNYNVLFYSFNSKNKFKSSLNSKVNYRLEKDSYENVKAKYSIHRRRNVRITTEIKGIISFSENKNLLNSEKFFLKNILGVSPKVAKRMFRNMLKLQNNNLIKVFDLYYKDTLVSQAYLVNALDQYILVNFINDKNYLKYNTSSIIIDQILQRSIAEKSFNFHGSNIPSIAQFYKRFGAIEEKYNIIQNSKFELLKNIFIKH